MDNNLRLDDSYFEEFMSDPKFIPESTKVRGLLNKFHKNEARSSFLFLKCDSMNTFKKANCNYFKDVIFPIKNIPKSIAGVEHRTATRLKQIVLSKALFDYVDNRLLIPTPTLVVNNDRVRKSATDTSYLNKKFLSGFVYSLINIQIQDLDNRTVLSDKNINVVWKVHIDERTIQKNVMDK